MFQKRHLKPLSSSLSGSYLPTQKFGKRHLSQKKFVLRALSLATTALIAGLVLFVLLVIVAFAVFTKDLPSPNKLTAKDPSLSTQIFDRNGEKLYDIYGEQNRALVKLDQLPKYVKDATIAIEDKDFYKHKGFAPKGMLRAIFEILFRGRLQGGSTITQQVVKNTLLTPERTITRKIREFILAIQVERRYTKDEILQIYLNEVPYGGTAWGIEAAAQSYFGKKAIDLTLTEAVILTGMPQRPSAYSPFGPNPNAYVERASEVARRMREDGYITSEQEKEIKEKLPNVQFASQGVGIKAPHFVIYVRSLLEEQYGTRVVEQGGLKVTTSLDLKIQDEAQKIVTEEISKLAKLSVGNGGVIVTKVQTGEILAMVGSKDYFARDYDGKVNVTLAKRQPGSSIKPVNYASAFLQGYTPSFLIMDVPTEFPGGADQPPYKPVNYDGKFHGPQQVRFALGNSYNLPAVKMLAYGGIKNMLTQAEKMGLTTLKPTQENLNRFGLSLTLGGGEIRLLDMATAFGVFATGGYKKVDNTTHEPTAILKVEDSDGRVLQEFKENSGQQVLSEEVSFLISNILSDNNARSAAFGENSLLKIPGKTVAVKTGTTDDKRDNWTIGFTKSFVVGVWVGNNNNSPMNPSLTSGVTGAAPIWNRVMRVVLANQKDEPFQPPGKIVQKDVDALDGGLSCRDHPTRSEYFIKGTEPTASCLVYKEFGGTEYLVFHEEDPVSTDGKNRWQDGINEWVKTQEDSKYHPPEGANFGDNTQNVNLGEHEVKVDVLRPAPESQFDTSKDQDVNIGARVFSLKSIALVEVRVNGKLVASKSDEPYDFTYQLTKGKTGDFLIEITAINSQGDTGKSDVKISAKPQS